MAHTEGPWHIDWNGGMAPRVLGLYRPGSVREIAIVHVHNGSDDPQVHDNARLIAAAPELLVKLRRLATYADDFVKSGSSDDRQRLIDGIADAQAVQARATGGER